MYRIIRTAAGWGLLAIACSRSAALSGATDAAGAGNPGSFEAPDASTLSADDVAAVLAAHEAVRSRVDADPELPALTWSSELARYAQQWAEELRAQCNAGTLPDGRVYRRVPNAFGENVYARYSRPFPIDTPIGEAVASWQRETECWTYGTAPDANGEGGSEVCDTECLIRERIPSNGTCDRYTQLVARATTHVGCGFAMCEGVADGRPWFQNIWVCDYDPAGNVPGVAPY